MTVVQKGLFLQKPTMVNYFIFTGSDFVFIALFHCTLYDLLPVTSCMIPCIVKGWANLIRKATKRLLEGNKLMHELLSPSACDVVLQEIDITVFSSDHVINGPLVLGTRLGFGWKLATLFTCSYAVSWPTESTVANFIIKKADIIAPLSPPVKSPPVESPLHASSPSSSA